MKDLIFSITLNNHTLNIQTNHKTTVCSYDIKDKYTASLIFGSNTRAHVGYKNIMFSGTVTKQNIWLIRLDMHPILRKRNGGYFFKTTKSAQNEEKNKLVDNVTIDYPENILYLYNQIISDLYEQYSSIDNKEEFKYQLCEWLSELYGDVENLDEIVEYENYVDVDTDEEIIIERSTIKNIILNECKELFISFRKAEVDNKNKKSIITLKKVVEETPELHKIPHQFLCKEFDIYLDKNYEELIRPDIYYRESDVLYNIGMNIYNSYQYFIFMNAIEEKIDKILSNGEVDFINKDEIYSFFKIKYSKENIPTDEEFRKSVTNFVNDYVEFYHIYNKFISLFNSNYIEIEWNDKTIQLFQKYDKKEMPVLPQHLAEYEVYKYVIPYYRKHFFRKNSNKFKPVIEKMPTFISYASSVLDILFKYNILIDNKESVVYNEEGDMNSAYEEIEKIAIL